MCDQTATLNISLPSSALAPRLARQAMTAFRCVGHPTYALDDATLLVSELVTNAVQHGAPPVVLSISCDAGKGLVVEVSDGSVSAPRVRSLSDEATGGRGMALVDLMSAEWGFRRVDAGKRIWFRLGPERRYRGQADAVARG